MAVLRASFLMGLLIGLAIVGLVSCSPSNGSSTKATPTASLSNPNDSPPKRVFQPAPPDQASSNPVVFLTDGTTRPAVVTGGQNICQQCHEDITITRKISHLQAGECLACHQTVHQGAVSGPPPLPKNSVCTECHSNPKSTKLVKLEAGHQKSECLECHEPHLAPQPTAACATCHESVDIQKAHLKLENNHPSTKCTACHQPHKPKVTEWPNCQACHQKPPVKAPPIAHAVSTQQQCTECHSAGKAAPLPTTHAWKAEPTCQVCHQPSQVLPTTLPHSPKGRESCTNCHAKSTLAAPPIGHENASNQTCQLCHEKSVEAPPLPHPVASQATCTSCHAPGKSAGALLPSHVNYGETKCLDCHESPPVKIPPIAHSVSTAQQCSECHGASKVVALPVTHQWKTDSICLGCHPASSVQPPTIVHSPVGRESCTNCHAKSTLVTPPIGHENASNQTCQLCHQKFIEAPSVPHAVIGQSTCSNCHAAGKSAGALLPSHARWDDRKCLVCHNP